MTTTQILATLVSAAVAYPLWTLIHEASHVAAARRLGPLEWIRWRLYPHRTERGNWAFAAVSWRWKSRPDLSPVDTAVLYSAPRLPDLLAAGAFPFAAFLPDPTSFAVAALLGGGLVDLAVGSMGLNPESDLQRTCDALRIPPFLLRVVGWGFVVTSAATGLARLFV